MSASTLPAAHTGSASFSFSPRALVTSIILLPRNLVLVILLAYRAVISPLYGNVCKYYPSCSAYGVGAVQQHGAVMGMFRSITRIGRCHPWAKGGIDDVPAGRRFSYDLTPRGFVVPQRKD